jgi:hypothetical protein
MAVTQVCHCGIAAVCVWWPCWVVDLTSCLWLFNGSSKVMVMRGDSHKGLGLERLRCHNPATRARALYITTVILYPILTVQVENRTAQSAWHNWPILIIKNAPRTGNNVSAASVKQITFSVANRFL